MAARERRLSIIQFRISRHVDGRKEGASRSGRDPSSSRGVARTRRGVELAMLVFAVVSVALSLAGLELGRAFGARMQGRADWVAGVVLIAVGALIAANVL